MAGSRLRLLLAAVCVVVLLPGCSGARADLRADQIIGVWDSDEGGTFVFKADGTFDVSGVKGQALRDEWRGAVLEGRGQWEIGADTFDPDGPQVNVTLFFRSPSPVPGRFVTDLISRSVDDEIELFFFIDDPDLGIEYRFHRVESGKVRPLPSRSSGPK